MKHTLLILLLIPISVWVETADAKPNSTIKGMGIDMGLKVFVESIKKTLPKKIDELTIFTNVEASRSKISHHYKVLASAKEIDVKGLKNFVTNYFVSTICENENSRFLVENVETFSYLYRDSSDTLFLSLDFSKNDCVKRIVASSDLKKTASKSNDAPLKNQLVSLTKEDLGKLKESFLEQAESHFATLDKDSPFKNISKEELREAFEEVVEPRFTTKQNDPAWYTSLLKVGIKTFMGWSVLLLPVFFFVAWINWPKKEK